MRIKNYSNEEIRENINNIVFLDIDINAGGYEIRPIEVVKVTERQFKTATGSRVNFAEMGLITYRTTHIFKKDAEEVIEKYKKLKIESLEAQIEIAQTEIQKLNDFKRLVRK
ncbi:hypothetical protein MZM54_00570 [[Brevibacterium] frigoritolerans]|nr:hypothetical protein [Peribacillus frigoritolerans]